MKWTEYADITSGDLYMQFDKMKEAFGDVKRTHRAQLHAGLKVVTQNVRGFQTTERKAWLDAIRRQPKYELPDIVLLQERRVKSEREAKELKHHWSRIWGLKNDAVGNAFFTVDDSGTGGVAILLNPKTVSTARPVLADHWNKRLIAVKVAGVTWINIYAPTRSNKQA